MSEPRLLALSQEHNEQGQASKGATSPTSPKRGKEMTSPRSQQAQSEQTCTQGLRGTMYLPFAPAPEPMGMSLQDPITLRGYLHKEGEKGILFNSFKGWKKRWFTFNEVKGELRYSKSPDSETLGCVDVKIATIELAEKGIDALEEGLTLGVNYVVSVKKDYSFVIRIPARNYWLVAETEKDLTYWINGLTGYKNRLQQYITQQLNYFQEKLNAFEVHIQKQIQLKNEQIKTLIEENSRLKKNLKESDTQSCSSPDLLKSQDNLQAAASKQLYLSTDSISSLQLKLQSAIANTLEEFKNQIIREQTG